MFNKVTEDYYYPAPEADQVLMDACGKELHSVFDCVWGFEQIDVDEETAEICSTMTPFGIFKSKKLPQGIKQGPAIYQHMQDSAFKGEYNSGCTSACCQANIYIRRAGANVHGSVLKPPPTLAPLPRH